MKSKWPTKRERQEARCQRKQAYPATEEGRRSAELAADRVALDEWERGVDRKLAVYECAVCGNLHIGTLSSRPVHPWLSPLHDYRHLDPPVETGIEAVERRRREWQR